MGGAFTAWLVVVVPLQKEILDNDLTLVYIGARIGLEHGWNQIYSLGAQVCVPNSNAGMRCSSSEGTKTDGRAFWSFESREWPASPGWRCGSGG